ncbi:MAG: GDSL-type esterase/lipase family protein [Pseudomonadota bacterium]
MRILFYESMDFDMEMWKYATIMKIQSNNPRIGHEHRPNCRAWLMGVEVKTNSFGLRNNETTLEKPPNTYRIVVLGDSITMGWGVPQDQTYPTQLERMFNTQAPEGFPLHMHYEILNLGIGNYNTAQEVTRLRHIGLQFDPDLILLAFFINDAEPVPQQKSGFLIEHSYLYTFVLSRLKRVSFGNTKPLTFKDYYRGLYTENQQGWQATKAALVELVDIGYEQ